MLPDMIPETRRPHLFKQPNIRKDREKQVHNGFRVDTGIQVMGKKKRENKRLINVSNNQLPV